MSPKESVLSPVLAVLRLPAAVSTLHADILARTIPGLVAVILIRAIKFSEKKVTPVHTPFITVISLQINEFGSIDLLKVA